MKFTYRHEIVFITFHRIKCENFATTENTMPTIIGVLKEFIVNAINFIAINANPVVKNVILNSLIIFI